MRVSSKERQNSLRVTDTARDSEAQTQDSKRELYSNVYGAGKLANVAQAAERHGASSR